MAPMPFSEADRRALIKQRRQEQLARQAVLLAQVTMLSVPDTIEVLKQAHEQVIILIDAHSGTLKVPAFQFSRVNEGQLVINPKIQEVHQAKGGYNGYPNLNINGAWDLIDWWYNDPMVFDASAQPAETPFVPISLIGDDTKLDQLVKWIEGWDDEPGFG